MVGPQQLGSAERWTCWPKGQCIQLHRSFNMVLQPVWQDRLVHRISDLSCVCAVPAGSTPTWIRPARTARCRHRQKHCQKHGQTQPAGS